MSRFYSVFAIGGHTLHRVDKLIEGERTWCGRVISPARWRSKIKFPQATAGMLRCTRCVR